MNGRLVYYVLFFVLGAAFLVLKTQMPAPANALAQAAYAALKASPIILLGFYVLKAGRHPETKFVAMGLFLSSAGDVFLELDPAGFFVYGLGSFLVAHLLYAVGFAQYRRKQAGARQVIIFMVIAILMVFMYLLNEKVPTDLKLPVMVYVVVIGIMVIMAALRKGSSPWVLIGALLFMISDACIALNKFDIAPIPNPTLVIMITYYLGQFGIGHGCLQRS
jgi:uncharacterized membrane protein YhhN